MPDPDVRAPATSDAIWEALSGLEHLAPAWLAQAEVSLTIGKRDRIALSFFFDSAAEFRDFVVAADLPSALWAREEAVRSRFTIVERYWVKLERRAGRIEGWSQYFQIDPRSHYPISSLRVFLRAHGVADVSSLEAMMHVALEREDTVWGLVLKPDGDGSVLPRLSCTVPRSALDALLVRLEHAGQLLPRQRAGYLGWNARLPGTDRVFVSFDPMKPGAVALDFEDVPGAALGETWDGLGIAWSGTRPLPYLKCRLAPDVDAPEWTAYLRRSSLVTHLTRLSVPEDRTRLQPAQGYFDTHAPALVAHLGGTYQAGLLKTAGADIQETAAATNRFLAERAGLEPGMRVLDAGCGALGPALDMAQALPRLEVDGITISEVQAREGQRSVRQAGLEDRVRVHVGDYHVLPFDDEHFDAVLFLESAGYSPQLERAFNEAWRVLRPGGRVYVKDVFAPEGALSNDETDELEEFNRTYAFHTVPVSRTVRALESVGFSAVRAASLAEFVDSSAFNRAMFEPEPQASSHLFAGQNVVAGRLNSFGRWHYRRFHHLELLFAEVVGVKPTAHLELIVSQR